MIETSFRDRYALRYEIKLNIWHLTKEDSFLKTLTLGLNRFENVMVT